MLAYNRSAGHRELLMQVCGVYGTRVTSRQLADAPASGSVGLAGNSVSNLKLSHSR